MTKGRKHAAGDGAHLEAALDCLKLGWAVVPAGQRAKRQIIRWRCSWRGPLQECDAIVVSHLIIRKAVLSSCRN